MPSRRKGGDLILFSADDPKPLVNWLVETHGIQDILRLLSEQQSGGTAAPTKRAYKKRGPKKGSKRGSKKGSKKGGKRKAQGDGNER